MQFCVIGLGRFGTTVALALSKMGHEVMAIDLNESKVNEIEDMVTSAAVLDATQEKALHQLGLEKFDCVIVAMKNLEASILITLLLKGMGVKQVVAKANSTHHVTILKKIGADRVVFPEREMGQRLARALTSPMVFDYLDLPGDFSIVEIAPPKPFHNKSIGELDIRKRFGIYVIAIRRKTPEVLSDGEISYREATIVTPGPDEEIQESDVLVLLGKSENIEKLRTVK